MSKQLVLYIACSVDGYIAKPNDDLSFLGLVEQPGEDYGYAAFMQTIDTVLIGRKTYDWVMKQVPEFPHAHLNTFVITRNPVPNQGNIQFYSGDITILVKQLKTQSGKNIFCDGGAEIVNLLLQADLIDELIISVIPVLLGDGIRLFKDGRTELNLALIEVKHFEKGLVQLHYKRKI